MLDLFGADLLAYFLPQIITHILVRNDLHILDMTRGLEDLAQNILGNTLVQATNVQSSLVRLRRRPATEAGYTTRRHDIIGTGHWRRNSSGDGLCVLWDVKRRRGFLSVFVARSALVGLRRWQLSCVGGSIGHS